MQNMDAYNVFDDEVLNAVYKTRNDWAESDAIRDANITLPAGVTKIVDISYTTSQTEKEGIWHTLDIYYPAEKKESYPMIVSCHGGGWFYGTKELYMPYCMHLASLGFAVVNFNYRRSPEYRYPAAFLDVCHVMNFLTNHAAQYHLDMDSIFMVGDSCGAQLASQYCIYATNAEYRNMILEVFSDMPDDLTDTNAPVPTAVALNCGIYNMWDILDMDLTRWYLPQTNDTLLLQSFTNILDYLNDQFPPTYLMMSVNDDLGIHTAPMKKCLEKHMIPLVYKEYGQDNEKDGHVFHLNMHSENGKLCNESESEFFKAYILSQK